MQIATDTKTATRTQGIMPIAFISPDLKVFGSIRDPKGVDFLNLRDDVRSGRIVTSPSDLVKYVLPNTGAIIVSLRPGNPGEANVRLAIRKQMGGEDEKIYLFGEKPHVAMLVQLIHSNLGKQANSTCSACAGVPLGYLFYVDQHRIDSAKFQSTPYSVDPEYLDFNRMRTSRTFSPDNAERKKNIAAFIAEAIKEILNGGEIMFNPRNGGAAVLTKYGKNLHATEPLFVNEEVVYNIMLGTLATVNTLSSSLNPPPEINFNPGLFTTLKIDEDYRKSIK